MGSWYTRRWWRKKVNTWKIIYLKFAERYGDMTDHRSYTNNLSSCEIKTWKNVGLNRIRTNDLCDTSAVFYHLGYQANWELVTWWVRRDTLALISCDWVSNAYYTRAHENYGFHISQNAFTSLACVRARSFVLRGSRFSNAAGGLGPKRVVCAANWHFREHFQHYF